MSRFTLNARDKKRVLNIAAELPDSDKQEVAREVDDYLDSHHVNPLMMAAQSFLQQYYGGAAAQMLGSDDDAHIALDKVLRELMVTAGERMRGVNVIYNEVA